MFSTTVYLFIQALFFALGVVPVDTPAIKEILVITLMFDKDLFVAPNWKNVTPTVALVALWLFLFTSVIRQGPDSQPLYRISVRVLFMVKLFIIPFVGAYIWSTSYMPTPLQLCMILGHFLRWVSTRGAIFFFWSQLFYYCYCLRYQLVHMGRYPFRFLVRYLSIYTLLHITAYRAAENMWHPWVKRRYPKHLSAITLTIGFSMVFLFFFNVIVWTSRLSLLCAAGWYHLLSSKPYINTRQLLVPLLAQAYAYTSILDLTGLVIFGSECIYLMLRDFFTYYFKLFTLKRMWTFYQIRFQVYHCWDYICSSRRGITGFTYSDKSWKSEIRRQNYRFFMKKFPEFKEVYDKLAKEKIEKEKWSDAQWESYQRTKRRAEGKHL